MTGRPSSLLFLLPGLLVGSACGDRFQAGLANAPSIERQNRPRRPYDVISNGPESCPSSQGAADPLVGRRPACAEASSAGVGAYDAGAWDE
jgi:hypothetical protein